MNMIDFRDEFQREWLPGLLLYKTGCYIDAINNNHEAETIEDLWDIMIKTYDMEPECFPFEFSVETYDYDDDIYFSIIEMPEIANAKGRNLAIYAILVGENKHERQLRLFIGETDYNPISKRCIFLTEFYKIGDPYSDNWLGRYNYGPLCKRDDATGNYTFTPVEKENELDEFIERAIEIYKTGE